MNIKGIDSPWSRGDNRMSSSYKCLSSTCSHGSQLVSH